MSTKEDLTEHQKKLQRTEENLNQAYRGLFKLVGISKTRLASARKLVLNDLDEILRAKTHFPDEKGHYCPVRAAIEEGSRKMARDMIDRIQSKPMVGFTKDKPNVTR